MPANTSLTPVEALNKILDNRVASTRITGTRTLSNMALAGRVVEVRKTNIDWPVVLGGEVASVGSVDADTTGTASADTKACNLKIGGYRIFHLFDLSRVAIQEARSVGPGELSNLFGTTLDIGINAIARKLNGYIYTGLGQTAQAEVVGLGAVLDNGATYATIDPATYDSWKAIVLRGSSRVLTVGTVANSAAYTVTFGGVALTYTSDANATEDEILQGLYDVILASEAAQYLKVSPVLDLTGNTITLLLNNPEVTISVTGNLTLGSVVTTKRDITRALMLDLDQRVAMYEQMYDTVLTHPAIARKYTEVFDTLGIQSGASLIDRRELRGLPAADLGHGGRYFNGYPIIEDPQCLRDSMITLDMNQVMLKCFLLDNSPANPDAISGVAINRAYGIPIHIAELPSSNSAKRTFEMYVMPQLQVMNRQAVQAIRDLA
jgi:hypothetical protein